MKVRPLGPWVHIDPEPPPTTSNGLYFPQGNLLERLSHTVGKVLAVGQGMPTNRKKAKTKYIPLDLVPGERVVFRGHLKDANVLKDGTCMVHAQDIIGVLGEGSELNLALPHNN